MTTIIQRLRSLDFNAVELKKLTGWPDSLVEDYLNLLNNINELGKNQKETNDILNTINEEPTNFIDVVSKGAKCDVTFLDDVITLSGTTLVLQTPLAQADVGKGIHILESIYAGRTANGTETTIAAVSVDGLTITLTDAASTPITATQTLIYYFTDDTAAWQAAIDEYQLTPVSARITMPDHSTSAISTSLDIHVSGLKIVCYPSNSNVPANSNRLRPNTNQPEVGKNYDIFAQNTPEPRLLWVGANGSTRDGIGIINIVMPYNIADTFTLGSGAVIANMQELRSIEIKGISLWGTVNTSSSTSYRSSCGIHIKGGVYHSKFIDINGYGHIDAVITATSQDRPYREEYPAGGWPDVCETDFGSNYLENVNTDTTGSSTALAFMFYYHVNGSGQFTAGDCHNCTFVRCGNIELEYSDHNDFIRCGIVTYKANSETPQEYFPVSAPGATYFPINWANYHKMCAGIIEEDGGATHVAYGMRFGEFNEEDFSAANVQLTTSPQTQGSNLRGGQGGLQAPEGHILFERGQEYNKALLTFYGDNSFASNDSAVSTAGVFSLNFDKRQNYTVTVAANVEFDITEPLFGVGWFTLNLVDANLFTVTWPVGIVWGNGTNSEPSLTSSETLDFFWDGTTWTAYRRARSISTDGAQGVAQNGDQLFFDITPTDDTAAITDIARSRQIFIRITSRTGAVGSVQGVQIGATVATDGNVAAITGIIPIATYNGLGTCSEIYANDAKVNLQGGGNSVNSTNYIASAPVVSGGSTHDTHYQFRAPTVSSATTNYAFYAAGGGSVFSVNSATGAVIAQGTTTLGGSEFWSDGQAWIFDELHNWLDSFNVDVSGNVIGNSFTGAGTGLTGTGASFTAGNATQSDAVDTNVAGSGTGFIGFVPLNDGSYQKIYTHSSLTVNTATGGIGCTTISATTSASIGGKSYTSTAVAGLIIADIVTSTSTLTSTGLMVGDGSKGTSTLSGATLTSTDLTLPGAGITLSAVANTTPVTFKNLSTDATGRVTKFITSSTSGHHYWYSDGTGTTPLMTLFGGGALVVTGNILSSGGYIGAGGDPGSGAASQTRITNATDTPTSPYNWDGTGTAPDGYIKGYLGTQAIVVPYWNT